MVIKEDVAINNVGSGAVEGTGVGPKGEPGVRKRKNSSPVISGMYKRIRGFKEFANGWRSRNFSKRA